MLAICLASAFIGLYLMAVLIGLLKTTAEAIIKYLNN